MARQQKSGFVIALDGPDGVGKTTQVQLLVDYLKQSGQTVHATRSSGGTPIGEELRKVSRSNIPRPAETDLYISLAMGEALSQDLAERKARGEIVVIDRSPLSIVAYNGYGSRLSDKNLAFEACKRLCALGQIDLIIVLTASQNTLKERQRERNMPDYFELQGRAYHKRVREGYTDGLTFLQNLPDVNTKVASLDATPDVAVIHQSIVKLVNQFTSN